MAPRQVFEYRVAQSQEGRITFVDGQWAGSIPLQEASRRPQPFDHCAQVPEWLQAQGQKGWELVSATVEVAGGQNLTRLYLKRELGSD